MLVCNPKGQGVEPVSVHGQLAEMGRARMEPSVRLTSDQARLVAEVFEKTSSKAATGPQPQGVRYQ